MKSLQRSFGGGEIAPEMLGRLDQTKYQTGLQKCENFEVLAQGPVVNRSGFEYVLEVKDSTRRTRIIPFAYSTQQTFILELGHNYIRFHTNGATLLNTAQNITSISNASQGVLGYSGADPANGTWMYLAAIGGMTQLNGRFVKVSDVDGGANTFKLKDLAGNYIDTSGYGVYTAGGTMASPYEVVTTYDETDLFDIHFVQSADVLTLVHPDYAPHELRRLGATNWTWTTITFAPSVSAPTAVTATPTGSGSVTYDYVVTSLTEDGEESVASTHDDCVNDLTVSGNVNTVTWTPAANAIRQNVYKKLNGLFGYVGRADGTTFVDDNITPDISITPPLNRAFASGSDYPAAVSYFDQRRGFAGTPLKLQSAWLTRSGTEANLGYSIPARDDDSIQFRIVSRGVQAIRHLVPLSDLVALTESGEWVIQARNSDFLTPTSVWPRQIGNEGANNVQPVITNRAVIYAQARGGRVREMAFRLKTEAGENGGYTSDDICVLAPHLFDGYTIADMAYTKAPRKTVWPVRSDGVLLGMTYLPEHSVLAWHQHTTQGEFESVAAVAEGNDDILYAVIARTVDGRDVRYIERQRERFMPAIDDLEDAFFVDSGLTYSGTATTTISGLWHLEGETVSVLADGAVHPQVEVANGAITLEVAASKVQVGLSYTADLETLPLALQAEAAGQGVLKNVSKVYARVIGTSGLKSGPSFDKLVEAKQRTTEAYGAPPAPMTKVVPLTVNPSWGYDGTLCIRQDQPLPTEVLSLVLEFAPGG